MAETDSLRAVFESIVDYVIVGGYNAEGNADPSMIIFVYRTGYKDRKNGDNFKPARLNASKKNAGTGSSNIKACQGDDALLKDSDSSRNYLFLQSIATGDWDILQSNISADAEGGWDVIFQVPKGITLPEGEVVHTVYVEMKNKHNTMNSAAAGKTYIKMQSQLLDDDDCACFLVEAIAKKSQNIKWSTTVDRKSVSHKKIRRVSLD